MFGLPALNKLLHAQPVPRDRPEAKGMTPPKPVTRRVECYHCLEPFDVPIKAMSLSCPACSTRVTLEDLLIKDTCWTSRLQTCGRLLVHRKGSLVASLIEARQGIEIQGHAEGKIISGGPVLIGARARLKGDVQATSIWVEPGATIEGGYFQIVGSDRLVRGPSRPPTPPAAVADGPLPPDRPHVVVPAWAPVMRPG